MLGPRRQLVAARFEKRDSGGESLEGGSKLVADVGAEARLALDAFLQAVGHRVESRDEIGEVGRIGGDETRVELPAGDGRGCGGHVAERPQGTGACETSDESSEQRDGQCSDRKREEEDA